ncbi:MAG: TetR/AcrR family transcriptional regulator [Desulfobacterales bacterium]|nr:TetR/AcrR family transcriptional regulator [Desulfobacterales bacterium]
MTDERVAERRTQILSAALDVFAEKGYHSTKISDIAEKLNMGHGTFYRYFKNKLDIFSSVIDEIIIGIKEALGDEDPERSNTIEEYQEQIQRIGDRLFDFFMKDNRLGQVIFYENLRIDPELHKKTNNAIEQINEFTKQYLINGVKKKFLNQHIDTTILAKAINSMIFASIKDFLESEKSEEICQRWTDTIALLQMKGIAASSK